MDRVPVYETGDEGSNPSGDANFQGVAQLVECLLREQEVGSSSLPALTAGVLRGVPFAKYQRPAESELSKVVRSRCLNGIQVAKISETAILLRLLARGFNPFGSVFDGDRADWLVEVPSIERIWKIQVKTAHQKAGGAPVVYLTRGAGHRLGHQRYTQADFDFIVGFDLYADIAYVWSWDEVQKLRTAVAVHECSRERWDKLEVLPGPPQSGVHPIDHDLSA